MADKVQPPKKIRTDLTGRHDVTTDEIIKGLTPPTKFRIVSPTDDKKIPTKKK